MHIMYLGVVNDVVVSLFLDVTDTDAVFPGNTVNARLDELWFCYRDWCEQSNVSDRAQRKLFSRSVLFTPGHYAEISQKVMNATAARFMVFFMASLMRQVLEKLGDAVREADYWAAGVCFALAAMERIQLESPRILDPAVCQRFYDEYLVLRASYNRLAALALEQRQLRWHMRPKMHMFEHAVLDFLPLNFRYCANFLNEDFIRRGKALALCSHPLWMSRHVLFRYAVQFCLRWKE